MNTWSRLLVLSITFNCLINIVLWKVITKLIAFFKWLIKFKIGHLKWISHKLFCSLPSKFRWCNPIFWRLFFLLNIYLILAFLWFRNTWIWFSIWSLNFLLLLSCCSVIFLIFRRSMLTIIIHLILHPFLMIINTIL